MDIIVEMRKLYKLINEQSVDCPCGRGKILKRHWAVTFPSTWGKCEDEYLIECEYCKEKYNIVQENGELIEKNPNEYK